MPTHIVVPAENDLFYCCAWQHGLGATRAHFILRTEGLTVLCTCLDHDMRSAGIQQNDAMGSEWHLLPEPQLCLIYRLQKQLFLPTSQRAGSGSPSGPPGSDSAIRAKELTLSSTRPPELRCVCLLPDMHAELLPFYRRASHDACEDLGVLHDLVDTCAIVASSLLIILTLKAQIAGLQCQNTDPPQSRLWNYKNLYNKPHQHLAYCGTGQ